MSQAKLRNALAYAEHGLPVFQIKPDCKAPPLLKNWTERASVDVEEITRWYQENPDANFGVHCAGLIVLDVDTKKAGQETLARLRLEHDLPDTYTVNTPSGGQHLYYRSDVEVANGVDVLGPGIDIRSRGGYVVGEGSTIGDRAYEPANECDIAPAPDWLVAKCKTARAARASELHAAVPDAPVDAVRRASEWLALQPAAIEGQGGDAHTYAMACGLRDRGLSEAQTVELLAGEWNARCAPPWPLEELQDKVRNAFTYAQDAPGRIMLTQDDFAEPVEIAVELHTPSGTAPAIETKLWAPADISEADVLRHDYIVKGWLDVGAEAVLFGEWNAGKSFVVLDLAASVAQGIAWFGARVRAMPVLYLGYEGHAGLRKRVHALNRKYTALAKAPFACWPMAHAITSAKGREEVEAARQDFAKRFGVLPGLVIIDPLRNALGGSDSDPALVEQLRAEVRALLRANRCSVLLVHHSGHSNKERERGDSGIPAGTDSGMRVDKPERPENPHSITATKQRDSRKACVHFRLQVVELGTDQDGDPVTTCTVEPSEAPAGVLLEPAPDPDQQIDEAATAMLRLLVREGKAGREHSRSTLSRLGPSVGVQVRVAVVAIDRLQAAGRIADESTDRAAGCGRSKRLVIVGEVPEEGAAGLF